MANRGQTRESLLHALRRVFEAQGYAGATLNQLADACELGKASLYHHFPGGKAEMAAVLLRESVAELERLAFSRLSGHGSAGERLVGFLDGFDVYVDNGRVNCLIAVFAQSGSTEEHAGMIHAQYGEWLKRLTATLEDTGAKPKRAERDASDLLAGLYGHLTTARLLGDPAGFGRHLKRMKKRFAHS